MCLRAGRRWGLPALALALALAGCGGQPDPYGRQVERAVDLARTGEERFSQGEMRRATRSFDQSLEVSRGIDYPYGVAQQLNNLGTVALERGEYAQARDLLGQALRINRELNARAEASINLANLATLAQKQGQPSQAGGLLEEALDEAAAAKSPEARARVLCQLAGLALDQGDAAAARQRLTEAQPLIKSAALRGPCQYQWGRLALAQGEPGAAVRHFEAALAADRQVLARGGMAADLMGLGEARAALGDWDRAFGYYSRAFDIYAVLKQPPRLTECFSRLTQANAQGGLGYDLSPFVARLPETPGRPPAP